MNTGTEVSFDATPDGKVNNATGDLTGLISLEIDHADFIYNPFGGSINPLVTVGGFSFVLQTIQYANYMVNGDFTTLNIGGKGIGSLAGFDDTAFSWSFSGTRDDSGTETAKNYSATLSSILPRIAVPDGGTTLTLLGFSIAVLMTASRTRAIRRSAKSA
ncbi:hypothetical protein VDG1235_47 [Verrucomicrobiia bacterium DG1235]|nr:hypothetical protein VDG1235_47 [Verrucomicrobiae bacterium DG1235]